MVQSENRDLESWIWKLTRMNKLLAGIIKKKRVCTHLYTDTHMSKHMTLSCMRMYAHTCIHVYIHVVTYRERNCRQERFLESQKNIINNFMPMLKFWWNGYIPPKCKLSKVIEEVENLNKPWMTVFVFYHCVKTCYTFSNLKRHRGAHSSGGQSQGAPQLGSLLRVSQGWDQGVSQSHPHPEANLRHVVLPSPSRCLQ